jgi:hypothetical protein
MWAASLAKCFPSVKPHLTDNILMLLIQNHLFDGRAVDLAMNLIAATQLKVGSL